MRFSIFILIIFIIISCHTNEKGSIKVIAEIETELESENQFDSLLAEETGADEYGMKKYVVAYLKSGPNRSQKKAEVDSLQHMHMENISKMAKEGKLVVAGPFLETDYDVRGIYIFNTSTIEEAEEWTSSDPAIQAGSLTMELHPWYGSAALMKVNDIHNRLSKIKF